MFARRDRLVEAFHTEPDMSRRRRIFNLIVQINARLLEAGRVATFERMRAL